MLGYIYVILRSMVFKLRGEATWHKVLQAAGYKNMNMDWDIKTHYDDKDTYNILRATVTVLGLSLEDVYETYGVHFFEYVMDNGWDKLIRAVGYNFHEFVDNLSSLHFFISQIVFQTTNRPPSFKCEARPDGSLRLHYYSPRQGFYPIVKGVLRQASRILFNVDIKMFVMEHTQDRRGASVTEHVIFTVEALDDTLTLTDNISTVTVDAVPKPLPLSVECFCTMFPTHICFNKQLTIEHCGDFLYNELELASRRSTKLTDIFTLVQPDDVPLTFKGIQMFSNCLFVFHLKQMLQRRTLGAVRGGATGGGEKEKTVQPRALFALKGQMMVVNGGNSLLYMSSPNITTVQELSDATLFLSDLQLHDATRDLIMLNTTRISQQELNKKLEETLKAMKSMAEELEKKKGQTEHLLLDCLPPLIADQMRKNHFVPAQEFPEATCMQCDFPHFGLITTLTTAMEVVSLISEVFNTYDHLIEMHGCYKVVQLMDSYFIISGVPDKQVDHVDRMLNLALGIMMEAKQLIVPQVNLPVLLRISIHTGQVITCIVGTAKIRFVVMGETVNVSKRLNQHILPGKILVTNAAKLCAGKASEENQFEFTNRGYLNIGNNQATCTFYLEKNLKKTIWNIIDKPRGPRNTSDGYKELHSTEELQAWELLEKNIKKKQQMQQKAITAMKHQNGGEYGAKIRKVKDILKASDGEDGAMPKNESATCALQ